MVKLPVRKCYLLAKIGVLFLLVVSILSLFERWRGGQRTAGAQFADLTEEEYERQILEDEARIVPGLGAEGAAAYLTGQDKILGEESEKKLAINTYLSDRIAYNRTLTDFRNPACNRVVYDAELPSASVIIIFHNEPYSVVVRTLHSVLDTARRDRPWHSRANFVDRETGRTMTLGYPGQDPSSEHVYLKEIVLVDDNSTLPELRGKLSHYIASRLPRGLVRVLRLPDRVGLTRARLAGARLAGGDVLVFLDAHCEGQPDWLRPLLQRIKDQPRAVLVPIIDVIEADNFYYSVIDKRKFQVGGFTFAGHFTWIDVPEREKKRRGSDIAPTWSPTMAGGLFAISRPYYWELGAYDEQMAGWGGENLEMSFRIWQCGGTLETIPCSRVGHVFRSFHPYGLPAESDTHGINTARMAEVWMDEYAELFYLHRPDLRYNSIIGDVTHRKILREKLHCKSFQWYLDNVYREKFVPVRDVAYFGRAKNPITSMCLDTMQREGEAVPLGFYPCHSVLSSTQYFSLSLTGQLRDEENCATVQYTRNHNPDSAAQSEARRVVMTQCSDKHRGQKWRYIPDTKQLQHIESGLCLSTLGAGAGADALARACQPRAAQQWAFDYGGDDAVTGNNVLSAEQEQRLQKLRAPRRKSRSLMSRPSALTDDADARRRRKRRPKAKRRGKKKSHKNKFVLLIERTLMNNSEEHLELDVHCAHKKLLPNNTFVRDLVTILNEKNIRVINNGRVFERNRVTQLGKLDPRSMRHPRKKVLQKMALPAEAEAGAGAGAEAGAGAGAAAEAGGPATTTSPLPLAERARGEERAHAPPAPAHGAATTPGRIIVEDFIEIKRPASPKPSQRSHKRKPRPPPAAGPEVGAASVEDSPMVMSKRRGVLADLPAGAADGDGDDGDDGDGDDGDGGYWTVGYGAPRRNATRVHPFRQNRLEPDTEVLDTSRDADTTRRSLGAAAAAAAGRHRADALAAQDMRNRAAHTKHTDTYHKRDHKHKKKPKVDKESAESAKSAERTGNELKSAEGRRGSEQSAEGEGEGRGEFRGRGGEYAEVKGDGQNLEIVMDESSGNSPVKLVMKSNLTFDLGDELLAWTRPRADHSASSSPDGERRAGSGAGSGAGSSSDTSSASDSSD